MLARFYQFIIDVAPDNVIIETLLKETLYQIRNGYVRRVLLRLVDSM